MKPLDRVDDAPVERTAALVEQSAVRDLMGQRVLERVLEIWEQRGLMEELCRLQLRQPRTKLLFGLLGNLAEQNERHVLADDRGNLEKSLRLQRKVVDACREHHLHRGRDLDG